MDGSTSIPSGARALRRAGALVASICLAILLPAVRGADNLVPGADLADCRSALRVGPSDCEDSALASDARAPEAFGGVGGAPEQADLEKRVDAYLSNYGKPPREAVRALLDPSDTHIRELLHKQEETLAIASYVATRMTQLHDAQAALPAADYRGPPHDPGNFAQMRVRLVANPHGDRFAEALQTLRGLARDLPAIQSGVLLVGAFGPRQLRDEIARIDPMLSVDVMPRNGIASDAIPFFRIDDLRNRRSVAIVAQSVTARQLFDQIARLRQEAPGGVAPGASGESAEAAP